MKKVAIVTGVGRRRGIGAAICRELAKQGYDLFFSYWNAYDTKSHPETAVNEVDEIAKELRAFGTRIEYCEVDLSKPDGPKLLFSEACKRIGVPTVLINNAAVSTRQPLTDTTAQLLDDHYAVNVRATTLLCVEFVISGATGKIVNLTSGQSLGLMESELPYTITKASIDMLVQQTAPELKLRDICINAFDPGPTDTGWITDDIRADIEKNLTIHTPDEVAIAVMSLLGTEMTGEIIHFGR